MRGSLAVWAAIGLICGSATLRAQTPQRPGCAASVVFDLAAAMGQPLSAVQEEQLAGRFPEGASVSMLDLLGAAADYGFSLDGVTATLDELKEIRGPVIAHLAGPDHFVVLALRDEDHCQVFDNGGLEHKTWEQLQERFSGHVLILASQPLAGPRLAVRPVRLDPNRPAIGEQTWQVTVQNAGDGPLHVESAGTSCDCLAVEPGVLDIAPGKEARLALNLEARAAGRRYWARFATDDASSPRFVLECGTGVPPSATIVMAEPRLHVRKGQAAVRWFRIEVPTGTPIKHIRTGSEFLTTSEPVDRTNPTERAMGRQTFCADLIVSPLTPPGAFETTLRVVTESEGIPVIGQDVNVEVEPDLKPIPGRLFFGLVHVGDTATATIQVVNREAEPFSLSVPEGHDKRLSGTVGDLVDGRRTVDFVLRADRPGVLRTEITLATDVPQEEKLVIPVYAEVW